jgi:hypothetical protein
MPYQSPITIKSALDRISKNDYVLPAIQREFIWTPEQITGLFDSLMQGFPVGSFLFWKIDRETSQNFSFFGFSREFHQRDNPHCPPLGALPDGYITAVLDGQQRLTALNIGLRGSLAFKQPNKRWSNPNAYPVKTLHLNLLHDQTPNENGEKHRFEFRTETQSQEPCNGEFWFPVKRIFNMNQPHAAMLYLAQNTLGNNENAVEILLCLQNVVHTALVITAYEEESQSIERVLSIFIRTNSAGTALSYSDLLLSIAAAQWEKRDVRSELNTLVSTLNNTGMGFNFSKDLVLKAGLMLSDIAGVGFKVENFNLQNMQTLENNWPTIAETLRLTIRLIASFGLSRDTINADSVLLPVAYYLHKRRVDESYLTSQAKATDRTNIKNWIVRSLLKKGIWGSGLDVLLSALRSVIREEASADFPSEAIEREMRTRGKNLSFSDEEIEELADTKYGNRDLFGLMTLMFPFIDTRNQFHIDHVFPRSAFYANRLRALGLSTETIDSWTELKERLPNLQLLAGPDNQSKSGKLPEQWLTETFTGEEPRNQYISQHLLGDPNTDLKDFEVFYTVRRKKLIERINSVLNKTPPQDH